jgi:hypothetical protein
MMPFTNRQFPTLALCALILLSMYSAAVCAPEAGGWDSDPKPKPDAAKPKEKPEAELPKEPARPTYPTTLQTAVDKFNETLTKDQAALDAANAALNTKLFSLHDAAEPKLLSLLKSETIRLAKINRTEDAKTCKDLLANHKLESVDWAKVPSERIKASFKRVLTRETALRRSEQRKINSKQKKLDLHIKTNAKLVVRRFDKLILTDTKAGLLDRAMVWKTEKKNFIFFVSSSQSKDPSLVLFLKFDEANLSPTAVKDLSLQKHIATIVGKVTFVQDPTVGGCLQFSGGHLLVPPSPKFTFSDKEEFTLVLRVKPPKIDKAAITPKIARKNRCIALFGTQHGWVNYGVWIYPWHNNAYGSGFVAGDICATPKWTTVILLQKGTKSFLFVNGGTAQTRPASSATGKKGLYIGMGHFNEEFFGQIREVRLYRRALSEKEMNTLNKERLSNWSSPHL